MPVTGLPEFTAALGALGVGVRTATRVAVEASGELVRKATVDKLMLTEHARGTPTPSAPGDPPAMITGGLKASVRATPVVSVGGYFSVMVYPSTVYARIQELGGVAGRGHHSHLPARPYLQPALKDSEPLIEGVFAEAWSTLG